MTIQNTALEGESGLAEVEWALGASKSGEPTLRIADRYAHSQYTPRREAERVAEKIADELRERDARLFIGLGSGLGYVYEALLERIEIPVILWEPFPRLARAIGVADADWWEDVIRVESPEAYEAALDSLHDETARPYFFVHPGYDHPARFEARYLAQGMRYAQQGNASHSLEQSIVSPRSLDFLCRYPFVHIIDELRSRFEGQTAVVVSAGPSLHLANPALRDRSGGIVLAALQAVRPVTAAGASIDFGVIADPRDYSEYIDGVSNPYQALLADSSVEPHMLDRAPESTYVFHLRSPHIHEQAWLADGQPVIDEPTATVSEVSLLLAHTLGARRIILAGVDLDPSDDRYNVRFRVPGADGSPTWTNFVYFHAARCLNWLCPRIADAGSEIYRMGNGLPLRGTLPLTPAELADMLADSPPFDSPEASRVSCRERWKSADTLLRELPESGVTPPANSRVDKSIPDFRALVGAELRRECEQARRDLAQRAAD